MWVYTIFRRPLTDQCSLTRLIRVMRSGKSHLQSWWKNVNVDWSTGVRRCMLCTRGVTMLMLMMESSLRRKRRRRRFLILPHFDDSQSELLSVRVWACVAPIIIQRCSIIIASCRRSAKLSTIFFFNLKSTLTHLPFFGPESLVRQKYNLEGISSWSKDSLASEESGEFSAMLYEYASHDFIQETDYGDFWIHCGHIQDWSIEG